MSALLTAAQVAEVDRYIASPEHLAWEQSVIAKWNLRPSGYQQHVANQKERKTAFRNAASARRHSSKMRRTPAWADLRAIRSIYAEARRMTRETGIAHHVDHEVPLQGRLVSGLHVETNLRIITGAENIRKNNRFEVEE